MKAGECPNRGESSPMNDTSKSLVLVNYFRTVPLKLLACGQNNNGLLDMTKTCHSVSSNRWANFLAVDFYKVPKQVSRLTFRVPSYFILLNV